MSAFTSNRNLIGMACALGGVGLVLTGVVTTGWPIIIGGLYLFGLLAAPSSKPSLPAGPPPAAQVPPASPGSSQPGPAASASPIPPAPSPFPPSSAPPSAPSSRSASSPPGQHPTRSGSGTRPSSGPLPAMAANGPRSGSGPVDLGIEGLADYAPIGSGGFSRVYVATDIDFNRKVAVKVLHDGDEVVRRWFERERAIMGQLSDHPNIITPFRAGFTATGAPFLVMEYVPGGSLDDLLRDKGLLRWEEAVDHLLPVCDALSYAHQHDVIHKDIKPANILLTRHTAKLTDFGISALREGTASETAFTLAHCPPEAFADGRDRRDARSDLYSLASTLHTLITGDAPFDVEGSDSQAAYLIRIADHPPPAIPAPLAPGWLRDLVLAALAKDPDRRPPSVADFERALQPQR